jgi:signal transduction histidine kinase
MTVWDRSVSDPQSSTSKTLRVLLIEDSPDDADQLVREIQREYLNDILTSGKHLLQLINDVLDLAKIEAGKIELDLRTFSLEKAVDEVCTVMRQAALKKHIKINTKLPPNLDWVTLDERKFKQILYNLLSNAVKFSDYEREVDVIVEPDSLGQIRLQVKDSGIGIKKADLPRLFREFEQLDCGADRRYQGTGLGLALTKKIVEFQGGSITVESEFGKGSSFIVRLPSGMTNSVRNPQLRADIRSPLSVDRSSHST